MGFDIRLARQNETESIAALWHRSGIAAYHYLPTWQAFTSNEARRVFRTVIVPENQIWVGIRDSKIEAYLALNGDCIDRLYVDPIAQRTGWGTRMIQFAKQQSPTQLRLFTHVQNTAARALYEKHGFVAVKFGISPPPESAPDVEYHWHA